MAVRILHFLGFQLCWFASVLSAARGAYWLGPICVGIFAVLHFTFLARRSQEVLRLFAAGVFGLLADAVLILAGAIRFGPGSEVLPPVWMTALWILFMTTLPISMPWLRRRHLVSALVGAVAGPVCYVAGHKLGALSVSDQGRLAIPMISVMWCLATPFLVYLTERTHAWNQDEPRMDGSAIRGGAAS